MNQTSLSQFMQKSNVTLQSQNIHKMYVIFLSQSMQK